MGKWELGASDSNPGWLIVYHLKPDLDAITRPEATPQSAGWKHIGFQVLAIKAGTTHTEKTNGNEIVIVSLDGRASLSAVPEFARTTY